MKNYLITFCLIVSLGIDLYSQDLSEKPPHNWNKYLHLESGFIFPKGTIKESIAIRQNISSYYVDQTSNGEISTETSGFIFGLRWEYFNIKFKTGVSTGLRYTGYRCKISGFSSSNADFFYLRYSMLNSDTKFARVKSIIETKSLISIPLEFRTVLFQYKEFGLFAKVGAEFSKFILKKNTNINFQENNMEINEEAILNNIGAISNKLYSTLYGSIGVKLGRDNKLNYIFEVFLPSFFLSKNNFSLIDVDNYKGFKLSLQFPINK